MNNDENPGDKAEDFEPTRNEKTSRKDPELAAKLAITKVLEGLKPSTRDRVIKWIQTRYCLPEIGR